MLTGLPDLHPLAAAVTALETVETKREGGYLDGVRDDDVDRAADAVVDAAKALVQQSAGQVPTDRDVLRAMLTRAGVVFTEAPRAADPAHPYTADVPAGLTIDVEQGNDSGFDYEKNVPEPAPRPRNYGYMGFSTRFYFDDHGALFGVGAWE
jgi:hypothetical protein